MSALFQKEKRLTDQVIFKDKNDFLYTNCALENGNIASDVKRTYPHFALSCPAVRS